MIELTVQAVAAAAREAYAARALQAQQGDLPADRTRICTYAGPCAIGVAITPEQRALLDDDLDDTRIVHHVDQGRVSCDYPDTLQTLQDLHDCWHRERTPEAEAAFVAYLERLP